MTDSEVGKRLREARKKARYTQEALGQLMGVSRFTIMDYETGKTPVPRAFAADIQRTLGISADWLLTGAGEGDMLKMGQEAPQPPKVHALGENHRMSVMLQKTAEVLESESIYRTALASNINAFHQAIKTESAIVELQEQNKSMQGAVQEIKKQFSDMVEDMKALKQENLELKKELASGNIDQDSSGTAEQLKSGSPRKPSEQ